jgi:cell division septal protein FtsQ
LGENLLALDLVRVKRDLELCSAIQSAAVERALPGTLRIRISEREPIARAHGMMPRPDGKGIMPVLYQIDATGFVIVPLERAQVTTPVDAADLPLLVGASQADLRAGRRAESPQVQAAIQLIREFDQSPMAGLVSLKQIDCSSSEVLSVLTGQGSEVTFSIRRLDQQMRRWRSLYDYGQRNHRAIAAVDLSVADNIPARWLESSPVPPAAKPKSTSRPKKKNA